MATTITQPAAVLQPRKLLRQAIILAVVMAVGIGVGLLLDNGDDRAALAGGDTPAQRLQSLADSLVVASEPVAVDTRGATYDPAAGTVVFGTAPVEGPEHGEFSPMTYRDPSVITERFGGLDADLDPDGAPPVDIRGFVEAS